MVSVILGNIGSDNGLLPVRRHAITWTNVDTLLFGPLGKISVPFEQNTYIFFQENELENIYCKVAAICCGYNVVI